MIYTYYKFNFKNYQAKKKRITKLQITEILEYEISSSQKTISMSWYNNAINSALSCGDLGNSILCY